MTDNSNNFINQDKNNCSNNNDRQSHIPVAGFL